MNKHLALIIFIALAQMGCDKPTDKPSNAKPLTVINSCKPLENKCEITGTGVSLKIAFKAEPSYQRLLPIVLESTNALEAVSMTLVIADKEMPAEKMKNIGGNGEGGDKKHWEVQQMPFAEVSKTNLKLRLTVLSNGETYFVELPIVY